MSKLPTVNETLDLIGQLTSTVEEFASREAKLNYAVKLRTSNLKQGTREQIEAIEAKLEKDIAKESEKTEVARARVVERLDRRQSKLAGAQMSARMSVLQRIQDEEGYEKYAIQKEVIKQQRARDQRVAEAIALQTERTEKLAEWQNRFVLLEKKSRQALRAIPSLGKALKSGLVSAADAEPEVSNEDLNKLGKIYREAVPLQKSIQKRSAVRFFGSIPVSLVIVLILILCGALPWVLGQVDVQAPLNFMIAGITGAVLIIAVAIAFLRMSALAKRPATELISHLTRARLLRHHLGPFFENSHQEKLAALDSEFKNAQIEFDQKLGAASGAALDLRQSQPELVEQKAIRIAEKIEAKRAAELAKVDGVAAETMQKLRDTANEAINQLTQTSDSEDEEFSDDFAKRWELMAREWNEKIPQLLDGAATAEAIANRQFLPWTSDMVESWAVPSEFRDAAKFATLSYDLATSADKLPTDPRLSLPEKTSFELPVALSFPESGSVIFETKNTGKAEAIAALNNLILRILTGTPAGRAQFTIIDPVGLGENFAGIMHLADHEEFLISSRIWTQPNQIEKQLERLCDHMEKVIQMYLRNEYESITDYNEKAGNIAERFHFLVVADFPHGFSEHAARRLLSIANTGARCGVYTLIHWDQRSELPSGISGDDLRKTSVVLKTNPNGFYLPDCPVKSAQLTLDPPPSSELAIPLVNRIGQASKDSNVVQVPFSYIAPPSDADFWSLDTSEELRVPVGRTGATKLQYLAIGKGTCQHALIAGKTGSGKSTLFHVIITNLALWCDPNQVEFYLIDFKKGVEFKCYADAKLPHARVIAIESDREFGLSVLQRIDEELKRRGELFRKIGAQDVAGYKRAGGTEPIPRSLLLIDEFQEFFVQDDHISQNASLLLDRIVRQGRAFGIHAILGSQTLGGAFTLARATLGQMTIRIALQCNEADAYLIMDDSNPAPGMLTRPGEGIYNDSAGAIEGNSPFQVVWLGDDVRDEWISKLGPLAARFENNQPEAVIFEGNALADVRENTILAQLRESTPDSKTTAAAHFFLGAPNSIKGPTEILLQRQSGNNVLVVGQQDETVLGMIAIGLVGLENQFPVGDARFVLVDGHPPGSSECDFFDAALSAAVERPAPPEIGDTINAIASEMTRRLDENDVTAPPIFLFINGLQKFKKLRYEEDFSFSMSDDDEPSAVKPDASLNSIMLEGASVGIHLIVAVDTFNNVGRSMNRKAISEFEMRVLFQMSANDSASLIDTIQASNLGMNRALYFNQQAGYLETFRPYALPDREWFK